MTGKKFYREIELADLERKMKEYWREEHWSIHDHEWEPVPFKVEANQYDNCIIYMDEMGRILVRDLVEDGIDYWEDIDEFMKLCREYHYTAYEEY